MSSQRSARALADVNGGIILAEVEIAAPPERVFRALTQSDEIVRWWGSPAYDYPHRRRAPMLMPTAMSCRRVRPRQTTMLPGGGSWLRAR